MFKKKIKKIIKSYHTIIICLIILCMFLMGYVWFLTGCNATYVFSGKNDYVEINNGVISLNYDINLFEGSDITYLKEKDIVLSEYKIGYYVKDNEVLKDLIVISDKNEYGFSLKALLEGINQFNISEPYQNKSHFKKEIKNNLDNGLYFMIEGKTIKDKELSVVLEINTSKISK